MDELLKRVAELRGMPASLVERSAQARAQKTGSTLEAVLQEWAGEADSAQVDPAVDDGRTAKDDDSHASGSDPADVAAPAEVTTDHLVRLAADAKRMPPKLILSSATARAEHSGSSLEEVLADWAGVDLEELRQQAAETPTPISAEPPTEDEPETEDRTPKATAAPTTTALTMEELLERVVEVKGMPAALAKRSAEARSKKTGEPVEAVLAEWAGVDASLVVSVTEPSATSPESPAEQEPRVESPEPKDEIEVIEASPPEVSDSADEDIAVVGGGYPRWLAAAFVLIPLLAVVSILVAPNGPDCGTAGQLLVDPATGQALNCDGSQYGVDAADYLAEGAALYSQCVACHGADGAGGVGPAFSGGAILSTFPAGSCDQHIAWVDLGTAGWPDPTYGATDIPVGGFGLMPAFGGGMTDGQIAAVSLYERVEFGGQPLEEAEIDCGLVTPEGSDSAQAAGS